MTLSSDPLVPAQPVPPGQPMSARNKEKAHALGLTSATGLVIGSIVGTGVFTMPAVLAGAGTMGIVVLGVIAVGAMLLAVLFGQLTKRVPNSDGGLYAYSRHEFGDFAGYLVGWCYWIQAWAGNAAIVSSWVFYVDALFGITHPTRHGELGHRHGRPVGAGRHQPGRGPPDGLVPERHRRPQVPPPALRRRRRVVLRPAAPTSGRSTPRAGSLYSGIGIAAGVALFSFIGVEAAAITAKRVQDPRRQRRPGLDARHRAQRRALRAGDRGGDGPGGPPHPGQHRVAVRQRLPVHLPPRAPGPGSSSPPWP